MQPKYECHRKIITLTVESPSGKRTFTFEFINLEQAKILLDTLSEKGFKAVEQLRALDGATGARKMDDGSIGEFDWMGDG